MITRPGQTIYLRYKSPFRDTALFPQAQIYDFDSGDQLTTVNLSANATDTSLYENTYTVPGDQGKYSVVIVPYTGSGHTAKSDVEADTLDSIEVQTIAQGQSTASLGGAGVILTEEDLRIIAREVAK